MIYPGTNLCRVCGRTSHEHFYRSGKGGYQANMVWNSSSNKFTLTIPEHADTQPLMKLINTDQYSLDDFPPNEIQMRVVNERDAVTLYRSCPHCKELEIFPPDMGKLPCFVIAVIGALSAGKTAWLGALNNALDALSKQFYPYQIEPWKLRADVEAAESTRGYENGNTNYFLIIDAKTREPVAMIYLLDYAGELYAGQQVNGATPLGRILLGRAGDGYPGLDGAVYIEPAINDPLNRDRAGTQEVIEMFMSMEFRSILRKIPVARVCTFADKLIDFEAERLKRDPTITPLLTENTFPRTVYTNVENAGVSTNKNLRRYYTPEAIVRRIRLQDYIAREIIDSCEVGRNLRRVLAGSDNQFRHFLVQSCSHVRSDSTTDHSNSSRGTNDYRVQFNAADPLIWLMYQLELFPLYLTEGGTR